MSVILDGTLIYLRGRVLDPYIVDGTWMLVDLPSEDSQAEPFKALASGHNDASMALFYLYGVTRVLGVSDGLCKGVTSRLNRGCGSEERTRNGASAGHWRGGTVSPGC